MQNKSICCNAEMHEIDISKEILPEGKYCFCSKCGRIFKEMLCPKCGEILDGPTQVDINSEGYHCLKCNIKIIF